MQSDNLNPGLFIYLYGWDNNTESEVALRLSERIWGLLCSSYEVAWQSRGTQWKILITVAAFKMWCYDLGWSSGESWAPKDWCFWTVVLEKTLERPLDCKEIQPVHPKGAQSWVFIGKTDAEAETLVLWPPHAKNWLIGKDSDAGRDWGQEKGTTEDEMAGWHHWLDEHESEWTPGVGDGQGGLACYDSWGCKELDTTGLNLLSWSTYQWQVLWVLFFNRCNSKMTYKPKQLEKTFLCSDWGSSVYRTPLKYLQLCEFPFLRISVCSFSNCTVALLMHTVSPSPCPCGGLPCARISMCSGCPDPQLAHRAWPWM